MTAQPLLQFDNVTVRRGGKPILQELSFSLFPGEKVALTGPSGAGKSSVLYLLLGFLQPADGTIYFKGEPYCASIVQRIRSTTATVLQEPVAGGATVRESLLFPFSYKHNRSDLPDEHTISSTLESLGLSTAMLKHPVAEISGGEKQRIALARALLLRRDILLFDEITSALDDVAKSNVYELLNRQQYTVLSVTHDPGWITRCDRVIRLESGRAAGTSVHTNAEAAHDNH